MPSQCCVICGSSTGSRRCSGCQSVHYCTPAHQRAHWNVHQQSCGGFLITEDLTVGKQWVAAKNLNAGTILFTEDACLTTLNLPSNSKEEGKTAKTVKVCVSCAKAWPCNQCSCCMWPVCNTACAKADIHANNECRFFQKYCITHPLPESLKGDLKQLLFLIRAIKLKERSPGMYEEALNLFDDPENLSEPIDVSMVQRAMNYLKKVVGLEALAVTQNECEKLYRIVELNAMESKNPEWQGIDGIVRPLYLKISRINHSCFPNCVLRFCNETRPKNFPTSVLLIKDVSKGDPLVVNYIDYLIGTHARQTALKRNFGFLCKCERCVDPTEIGTFMSAVVCPSCRWGNADMDINVGYFLPRDPLDLSNAALWKCNNCHLTKPASEITRIHENVHSSIKKRVDEALENRASLDQLFLIHMTLVEPEQHDVLHPNHFALETYSMSLIDRCLSCHNILMSMHSLVLMEKHIRRHLFYLEKVCPGRHPTRATFLKALVDVLYSQKRLGKDTVGQQTMLAMMEEASEFDSEDQKPQDLRNIRIHNLENLALIERLLHQPFFGF